MNRSASVLGSVENWLWKWILPDKLFNQLNVLSGHSDYLKWGNEFWAMDYLYYGTGYKSSPPFDDWPPSEIDYEERIEFAETLMNREGEPRWFWAKKHAKFVDEHRQKWVLPRQARHRADLVSRALEEFITTIDNAATILRGSTDWLE